MLHIILYTWLLWLCHTVWLILSARDETPITDIPIPKTQNELDNEYILSMKTRFANSFLKDEIVDFNSNLDECIYDKQQMEELLKDNTNGIEMQWKRRVLYETTPRGNVIMFYNIYKMGFQYYSDVGNMHVDILNAVALKYVIVFFCRDLFMDEKMIGMVSKIAEIYGKNTVENKPNIAYLKKDGPFLRPKPKKTMPESETKPEEKKEYMKNKFIYVGKIMNYSFLSPEYPKMRALKKLKAFQSPLINSMMSYSDFKKSRKNESMQDIEPKLAQNTELKPSQNTPKNLVKNKSKNVKEHSA